MTDISAIDALLAAVEIIPAGTPIIYADGKIENLNRKPRPACRTARIYFEGEYGEEAYSYRRKEDVKLTERRFNAVLACGDANQAVKDIPKFEASVDRFTKTLGHFVYVALRFSGRIQDGKDTRRLAAASTIATELRELAEGMRACAAILPQGRREAANLATYAQMVDLRADQIDAACEQGKAAVAFRNQPEHRWEAISKDARNAAVALGEAEAEHAVHALKQGWNVGRSTEDKTAWIATLTARVIELYATAGELAASHGFDIETLDAHLSDAHSRGFTSELSTYNSRHQRDYNARDTPAHILAATDLFAARLTLFAAENGVFQHHWNEELSDADKAAQLAQAQANLPLVEARAGRIIDAHNATKEASELNHLADMASKHGGPAEWIAGLREKAAGLTATADRLKQEVEDMDNAADLKLAA